MIMFNNIGNYENSIFIQNYYSPFEKISYNSQINLYNPCYHDCIYYSNTNSKHIIKSSSQQQICDVNKSITYNNTIQNDKLHLQSQSQSLHLLPSCNNNRYKDKSDKIQYMSESMPTYSKGGSSNLLLTSPNARKTFLRIGNHLASNINK